MRSFTPEIIYPTSPAPITSGDPVSALRLLFLLHYIHDRYLQILPCHLCVIVPFTILKYTIIPLNELNMESKISACKGASGLPFGGGMRLTISLSILSTPIPVFALASIISLTFAAYQINNLILNLFRHCIGHIHLIQHRNYFKVMINSHIKI